MYRLTTLSLLANSALLLRILIGSAIFLVLAIVDLRRNGRNARRWREYLFLLATVAIAMIYGIINDLITSSISWEYFDYGKGLADVLGPGVPPNSWALHWEAAKIGMQATWTAGLIVGVALLVANNVRPGRPSLRYPVLALKVLVIFGYAVVGAIFFGLAGYYGVYARLSHDFAVMLQQDEMHPRSFMTVFGIHLGGYIGGLIGGTCAVIRVLRRNGKGAASRVAAPS